MSACRNILWLGIQLLLLVAILGCPYRSVAQGFTPSETLRKDFWDTDGTIHTILATNGTIYVGGAFSYVAPKGSKLVSSDLFTGATEQGFPAVYGTAIYIMIEDGNGGWFVGGEFNRVGNVPRTNLVHILGDNTIDPAFQPNPNGRVDALAVDGNKLYVGGEFTSFAGQPRSCLAAWDTSSQVVLPWNPQANGRVSALLVSANTIYAGGYFTQISGAGRRNIAAIETLSGTLLPWNPQADGAVLTMDLQDQTLYVGGFFNRIGGELRNGLAALDTTSTNALPWDPNPVGGKVNALKVLCNTVYVGGYFTNIAGTNRARIAAVDSETGRATAWNARVDQNLSSGLPSSVSALAVAGDRVYVGGQFSVIGGQLRQDLAAVDASTGQLLPWNPALNGGVSALAVAGRRVLSGIVTAVGGVERRNLAAFSETNGAVLPFGPQVAGPVYSMAVYDTRLFIGGDFTNVNGLARTRLAALNLASGAVITNWSASANTTVYSLATDGSALFVGGSFTTMNGLTRQRLAALNLSDGQTLASWIAHADGSVYALEVLGNNLYVGGSFVSLANFTRHRLAALSRTSGALQPWNPDANETVRALRTDGSSIYAGGSFTIIGNRNREHLAAINSTTGEVTDWNPGTDDEVRTIAVYGNFIFPGGIFLHAGGLERAGCAGFLADGTMLEWNPGRSSGNRIYAAAVSAKDLYLGGALPLEFQASVGGHALAAFPPEGFPTILQGPLDMETQPGQRFSFSVVAEGELPLSYFWKTNGTPASTNFSETYSNIAQRGDSGVYEVTVSNRLGIATVRATLTVLEPVVITSQPVSKTISNGMTLVLSVDATGNPPPIYQWRNNGVNIPGAVSPTLTLPIVTNGSGGSYYAVVGNRVGAVNSEVATVTVANSRLPFADDFANRGVIGGSIGNGTGTSQPATREPNEPLHAGKVGGKSLWVKWVAPVTGIATFSTRGSTFDTLLAVYTGTNLTNLTMVASDEDRGGFLTSKVDFNAQAGTEYQIAIDGLAGAGGPVVLSWSLDWGASEFPQITAQPVSQSVAAGGTAVFEVEASSSTPLSYQWFFGCRAIRNATNATLIIPNVGIQQVGSYRVFVMNGSTRIAESQPATLEISSFPGVLAFDKLEDLMASGVAGGNSFKSKALSSVGGSSPLLVSMGTIVGQTFDTSSGSSFIKETNHCGIIGGASAWIRFQPTQDGTVMVDTIGSLFDTVLAIYRDTNLIVLSTTPGAALVDCDDNGAPDRVRSQLKFPTKADNIYLAVVDGVLSAKGIANIHWQLGNKPFITASASNMVGDVGTGLTLFSGISSPTLTTSYQWYFNGMQILGATNSTLTLTNLEPAQAGSYTVLASNFVGMVLNDAAHVAVNVPLHFSPTPRMANGQFAASVWGNLNQKFVLQASGDLQTWVSLSTNTLQTSPVTVVDPNAGQSGRRFYRVRAYP